MAQATYASNDSSRVDSVRVARRQLLTARSNSELPPPRVVLHLPDLNALDGVVLGPPKPITHRRYDAAHDGANATAQKARTPQTEQEPTTLGPIAPTLANVLRVPLGRLAPKLASATNLERIGKLIVLLQQPKMLLAAVVAAGLQLAAVLAMITGQAPPDGSTKSPTYGTDSHVATGAPAGAPAVDAKGNVLRTPATIGFGLPPSPGGIPPTGNVAGPALVPSLPPPQNLPGATPGELPSWQAAPNIVGAPDASPTSGRPTLAPPPPTGANATNAATTETSTVAKPASASRPTRAKLVGTIKNLSTSGARP